MAQKLVIIDDLDGSEDAETIEFGLKTVKWTIDLSTDNYKQLLDVLAPFIERGTHVNSGPRQAIPEEIAAVMGDQVSKAQPKRTLGPGGQKHTPEEVADCKAWLRRHGVQKIPPARLPDDMWGAYHANDVGLFRDGRIASTE